MWMPPLSGKERHLSMAFSGTPVVTLVTDNLVRISPGSGEEDSFVLEPGQSGTITLFGGAPAGDVVLPETFQPADYVSAGGDIGLQDSIQVSVTPLSQSSIVQPISVEKTGTTEANFVITLTNSSGDESGGPELEIYVRFH